MVEQLVELALMALGRIGQIAQATRGGAGGLQTLDAEGYEQGREQGIAARCSAVDQGEVAAVGSGQRLRSLEFRRDLVGGGGDQAAWSRAGAARAGGGWSGDAWVGASFDDQVACDKCGDLGVAEFAQQAEDIAVDRFAPQRLAALEVAADSGGGDTLVERGGVERQQAAFAIAADADGGVVEVDSSENFLDFDADEVLAEFEGGAVEKFAVRLVGHAHAGESRVGTGAVDECGYQHTAAAPGQARGIGGVRTLEAGDALRCPVGIG